VADEDVLLRVQLEGGESSGSSTAPGSSQSTSPSADPSIAARDEIVKMREEIEANLGPFQKAVSDIRSRAADRSKETASTPLPDHPGDGDPRPDRTSPQAPSDDPDHPGDNDPRPDLPEGHVGSFDITKFRGRRKNQRIKEGKVFTAEAVESVRPPKATPVAGAAGGSGGGAAVGAAAGAAAGPVGIAVGVAAGMAFDRVLGSALNGIRDSAASLVSSFRELREQGDQLSGVIASANAQAEIQLLLARQSNLNQAAPEIQSLIQGQTEFTIAMEKFTTEIIEIFEPLIRDILDSATTVIRIAGLLLDWSEGAIQALIDKVAGYTGAAWVLKVLRIIDYLMSFLPDWADQQDANGAIDDLMREFFNPDRFVPPNNAFEL